MAPKRSRTSQRTTSYDSTKFVSEVAEANFEKLKDKGFLQERSLHLASDYRFEEQCWYHDIPFYQEMVDRLGWQVFYNPLSQVAPDLIYEFYANLSDSDSCRSMVRGRRIDFHPPTINAYYGLPDGADDSIDDAQLSDEQVSLVLTVGVGVERRTSSGTVPMTHFSREARFWRIFLAHNIHPTSQDHDVRWETQRLLYRILLYKKIDVGREISQRLCNWQLSSRQKLPFPHLIMGLCLRAGVETSSSMPLLRPIPPFDRIYIFRKIRVSPEVKERNTTSFAFYGRYYGARTSGALPPPPVHTATADAPDEPEPPADPASAGPSVAQPDALHRQISSISRKLDRVMRRQSAALQWHYQALLAAGVSVPPPPPTPSSSDEEDPAAV